VSSDVHNKENLFVNSGHHYSLYWQTGCLCYGHHYSLY
jgi:hypothetical protein